jgi:hypothetical protein
MRLSLEEIAKTLAGLVLRSGAFYTESPFTLNLSGTPQAEAGTN